jgi:hypothetical protein
MDTEIKYIADDETGAVSAPRKLTLPERYALEAWLPPKTPFDEKHIMEACAYWRNVYRIAGALGPHLIAMLSEAGALEAEQDPEQAMRNVLKLAGFQIVPENS